MKLCHLELELGGCNDEVDALQSVQGSLHEPTGKHVHNKHRHHNKKTHQKRGNNMGKSWGGYQTIWCVLMQ